MVQANSAREQCRDELIAFAKTHIDAWDSYADRETVKDDFGFHFVSRQTTYNSCTLTVSKATVPGLTLEKHQYFRENVVTQIPKIGENVTCVACPDVDGLRCVIQKLKMPMIMSDRSIPTIYYTKENEDGTFTFVASSKNTDEVVTAQAEVIGSNVVANNIINMHTLTPTADGCEWVGV